MPSSLVTGGAGFIGSHVAEHLVRAGHAVIVLDDLSGGFEENVPAGAKFVQGSIADHKLVEAVFETYRIDYVYHLAAYAAEGLSHFIKRFNYTNNLIGSVNLINTAINHQVKCFVFTSSIAVYGEPPYLPVTEETPTIPVDPYGIAKLTVEQELRISSKMFNLDYVIFRPHNVYGERQNIGDKYRNVIGIFMNQLLQGKPLTVFGDGEQRRAFTHIDDVAPIIAASPFVDAARCQTFNLGASVPYSVNELAWVVGKAMGASPKIVNLPARNEVQQVYADHTKAGLVFNCRPVVNLQDGLARMAAWAREHGPRPTVPFCGIEIAKHLPESWK
jgi:UDP-glucose 4-epimerase